VNRKNPGPLVLDLGDQVAPPSPATAPPVPDPGAADMPEGRAMQGAITLGARKPSFLGRWAWRLGIAILGFALSLWTWDFVTGLVARNAVLGTLALVLVGAFVLVLIALALREWAAFARLARLDDLHQQAVAAHGTNDAKAAQAVVVRLNRLYAGRKDMEWARARLAEQAPDMFDADGILALAETTLMAPLDAAARREVESAARQVATVTAVVPIALADLVVALFANLRMIRRIAEIYGGRSGSLGSWRLTRAVFAHLVATGAVAVGDDLIGSVAGGGALARVSRRFGEGVINGALTARVGVAAIEVCRPLPFQVLRAPRVTGLVQRALTGLFSSTKGTR